MVDERVTVEVFDKSTGETKVLIQVSADNTE
jgi:hypothetical protein